MRMTTDATKAAWLSETKIGPQRPIVRATIQRATMQHHQYNTEDAPGGDYDHERGRKGSFGNFLFGGAQDVREIRNLRKCSWGRSVDQDVAECTLTILNTDITPLGNMTEQSDDFDLPGIFSFSRGETTVSANRWGYHDDTGWNNILIPDRLVRTYEGYGHDPTVSPGDDPNLYISGTWVIDEVSYSSDGDLTMSMRDLGRLLMDAISFPPIIPWDDYPMMWSRIRSVQVPGRDCKGGSWQMPRATTTSSNDKYIGKGIVDKPKYVDGFGGVQGHSSNDPIRGDTSDYWLSTGQESTDSFVWWQETFDRPQNITGVRAHTVGGPYKMYVSLQRQDGTWIGRKKVPYKVTTGGVDLDGKIPFVWSGTAEKGEPFDIILKRRYADVKKVRITFTRLRRRSAGTYRWYAGLRKLMVYTGEMSKLDFGPGERLTPVGNYQDFTDIVKWVCAWSGLYWPARNAENYMRFNLAGVGVGNTEVHYDYAVNDAVLPKGRVWGSFQKTGTGGIADLTPDLFDKQPLIDVIQHIKEITGFSFWFDESGGAVWRMPNLYELGNYVTRGHKQTRQAPARTDEFVKIEEEETLIEYTTRLSSRNLRERVFVGDARGKHGTVVRGYSPIKTGLRRTAGWTDQNFETNRECRVAADMIVARQMFDYRRSKTVIWGNPAIQIDDQIRIFERVTNETFFHYVLGISSELDNDAGTWKYTLESHWLGERPSDAWVVRVDQMDGATQAYLRNLGTAD